MSPLFQPARLATGAARSIVGFLRDEEAVTAVEYAVMLAMILLVAIAAISTFGGRTSGLWDSIVNGVQGQGM